MNIEWTDKITNEELWRITQQKPIENQIQRSKWYWIWHTLRKEVGAIEKTALDWNSQGYRRIGRPKRTWRRTIEDVIRGTGRLWNEVTGKAGDCDAWKLFMMLYAAQGVKGFDHRPDRHSSTKNPSKSPWMKNWFNFENMQILYYYFWVLPLRLNFICRLFGTFCLFYLPRQCKQEN